MVVAAEVEMAVLVESGVFMAVVVAEERAIVVSEEAMEQMG